MKRLLFTLITLTAGLLLLNGCDEILGSKGDKTTDEIFEAGRQDPTVQVDQVAYAALLPFWDNFDNPTDVFVGYDDLVYITDANGLHVLDKAGRQYTTINQGDLGIYGATSVTQDRMLNVYVTSKYDTVITSNSYVDPAETWNLSAVYKIKNANGAGPIQFVDTLIHPFMDRDRNASEYNRGFRLNRARNDVDELVELTSVAVLANNEIYVSRKGPRNQSSGPSPDNTVLIYSENANGKLENTSQVRVLHPSNPSFRSGIEINDIVTLVGPPQRERMTSERDFIIAQGAPERDIPYRTLWIDVAVTIDGLEYRPNSQLIAKDTARAESFLYDDYKFKNPTGIAYSADARGHIFVVDSETDSLYMFQPNGFEGVNPPAGSSENNAINVSFGGTGNGPRQFDNPSGVAYYDEIVYVADTGNNRITRYKLSTDFE